MSLDDLHEDNGLNPDQQRIVDMFYPETRMVTEHTMDPLTGALTGKSVEKSIWDDPEALRARNELIQFFLHPEQFEASDFAYEVAYRRLVPGAPKKEGVWGDADLSDLDLRQMQKAFVTIDHDDPQYPPCINVHAQVREDLDSEWEDKVSGNLHTRPSTWIRRKMGATPVQHDFAVINKELPAEIRAEMDAIFGTEIGRTIRNSSGPTNPVTENLLA